MTAKIIAAIDHAARERGASEPPRSYLGASGLGERCLRRTWYGFRWAYREKHLGRLIRLFDRGHEEEIRFARYLREAGYELLDYDKETGRQWAFVDHEGHFAGNADGKVRGPHLPDGWGLAEFKTHNDKSFQELVKKGVALSKPVHWVQMQLYMHYLDLPWALYLAVNKNDDNLYSEIIQYKAEVAQHYVDLAQSIIQAPNAPPRISKDPSWFSCRYCEFREICHRDERPQKNCRSCAFAQPVAAGGWYCNHYHADLPKDFIPQGCDNWDPIR